MKELKDIRSNTLNQIKADRASALKEVKTAKKEALTSIQSAGGSNKSKVWLVIKWVGWSWHNAGDLEKIEMKNLDQCELEGAKWITSNRTFSKMGKRFEEMTYTCIEGA